MTQIYFENSIVKFVTTLSKKYKTRKLALIIDTNIQKIYGKEIIAEFAKHNFIKNKNIFIICLKATEANKNFATVFTIISKLLLKKFHKPDVIISIGGGICGDIAGFVAGIYKRGCRLIHVPTTLLAMGDSAIGGKTGINYNNIKNIIGVIKEPEAIFININFLTTITDKQFTSGLAEIIKIAFIDGQKFVNWLSKYHLQIIQKDDKYLSLMLKKALLIKRTITQKDIYDNNIRQQLNFGHTIGHAIEGLLITKNYQFEHGFCVAIGMSIELAISKCFFKEYNDIYKDLTNLLIKYSLPVNKSSLPIKITSHQLINYMLHDKKNENKQIKFYTPFMAGEMRSFHLSTQQLLSFFKEKNNGIT